MASALTKNLTLVHPLDAKPVSDRRSRDAAAGYGGNDHIVRAHTAAGTEQRGAPPPTQCTFTRRTIEEARRGGASLSEQRGHGGATNQRWLSTPGKQPVSGFGVTHETTLRSYRDPEVVSRTVVMPGCRSI